MTTILFIGTSRGNFDGISQYLRRPRPLFLLVGELSCGSAWSLALDRIQSLGQRQSLSLLTAAYSTSHLRRHPCSLPLESLSLFINFTNYLIIFIRMLDQTNTNKPMYEQTICNEIKNSKDNKKQTKQIHYIYI